MSQCSQSTDGFIKTLFGPRVAILCSQDAEIISRRNNLSFAELIRPFCTINNEIHVHDPTNQGYVIRDLHVSMTDIRCKPPDDNAMKQLLSDVVSDTANVAETSKTLNIEGERYHVNVNMSCPWFEAYRDMLTSLAPQKQHEFINHCPACLLVVSSLHPNPLEEFAKLSQHQNHIQHNSQHMLLRWTTPNTLKYYVLLHDNSHADKEKAKSVMSDLQAMYGNNSCYLLNINSKETSDDQQLPDPWGRFHNRKLSNKAAENGINMNDVGPQNDLTADPLVVSSTEVHPSDLKWMKELKQTASIPQKGYGCCLTLADHDSLRTFMQEFSSRGLIPHIEKIIRNYSEQITSRKAIHRSLFRATRTFFGGKTSSAPALKNYAAGGYESPELQVRKLADLFFLCQMYEHAYHYYHSVRKDFASEQAWLHAAGASEMAALSNFMQLRSQRPYPAHYVDSAVDTYLTTSNDSYLPLRCVLVSLECLRTHGMYAEATAQLLRLTSEENDLQSALMLEQIAQCFLRTKKPLLRKFAFHIVLAGHRYGKASQRTCALLCYKSALQVYYETEWCLAIDHINFTIGRQSYNLQQMEVAALSFQQLLKQSQQPASQQAMFLHEYLHVSKRHCENTNLITNLALPVVQDSKTTVRNTQSTSTVANISWDFLEESVRTVAAKDSSNNLFFLGKGTKKDMFEAVINEPLWIDITLSNPLKIALAISDISLITEFTATNKEENVNIESPILKEFVIPDNSENVVTFYLNPHSTGVLRILGMSCKLSIAKLSGFTSQISVSNVELSGKLMFNSDRLNVKVCSPMPKLQIEFHDFQPNMMCGEIKCSKLTLTNIGQCNMRNLKVAFNSSTKCIFCLPDQTLTFAKNHFLKLASHLSSDSQCSVQNLTEDDLKASEDLQLTFWQQGSPSDDIHPINLLFYYEASVKCQMQYRTLQYSNELFTRPSINVVSSTRANNAQDGVLVSAGVKNTSTTGFVCRRLSCDSESWKVNVVATSPLSEIDNNQSTVFYFQVEDKSFTSDSATLQNIDLISAEHGSSDLAPDSSKCLKLQRVSSIGKIVKPELVDYLVVSLEWKSNHGLEGQHYIHLPELKNDTSSLGKIGIFPDCDAIDDSSQSLVALHQLVKWKLNFTNVKEHDFEKSGLCFVNVKILLQNQYNCELRVNVNGMDSNQTQSSISPTANTRFLWAGKSLSKFIMPPKKTCSVTMRACFSAAGIYNLNSFSVWAVPIRVEDKTPLLPQNCHYSCLVSIHDSNYHS